MEGSITITENSERTFSANEIKVNSSAVEINCVGHCIICLRKVISETLSSASGTRKSGRVKGGGGRGGSSDSDHVAKAVVSQDFLNTFHKIWHLIQKRVPGRGDGDHGELILDEAFGPMASSGSFSRLPPLCQSCADKLQDLEDLVKAFKEQLEELWKLTVESKMGFHGEKFQRELVDSMVEPNVIRSTLLFLNMVSNYPAAEDEDKELDSESSVSDDAGTEPEVKLEEDQNSDSIKIENEDEDSTNHSDQVGSCSDKEDTEEDDDSEFQTSNSSNSEEDNNSSDDPLDDANSSDEDESDKSWNKRKSKRRKIQAFSDDDDDQGGGEEEPEIEISKVQASMDDDRLADPLDLEEVAAKNRSGKEAGSSPSGSSSVDETVVFKCQVKGCDKSYIQEPHLKSHYHLKHPDYEMKHVKHTCEICGDQVTYSKLMEHVRSHVGDYALKCPYIADCPFVASSQKALYFHYSKSSRQCKKAATVKNRNSVCDTCGFKTNGLVPLRNHLRQVHEERCLKSMNGNDFKCPVSGCSESFCVRQSVWFHLDSHCTIANIGAAQFTRNQQKCDQCKELITTGKEMEMHLKTSHQCQKVFRCQQCPFLFSSRVNLLDHLYVHTKNGVSCDICKKGVKYTRHSELRKHYRSIHKIDVNLIACEICDTEFRRRDSWKKHMKEKHDVTVPLIRGSTRRSITSTGKKRYPCEFCCDPPREFSSAQVLTTHKINEHGAEPFLCKTCGGKFNSMKNFSRHQKEHAGFVVRKEFKCKIKGCGKKLKSGQSLKSHQALAHGLGVKKTCEDCGKGFAYDQAWRQHRDQAHLGIKPEHICEMCGKRFDRMGRFVKHKRTMHSADAGSEEKK